MSERVVLSFPVGNRRFNYRVAGIIVAQGYVLVCREDDDGYVMLPGGRVELGEDSASALAREMEEELAMPAVVGPIMATSESFYGREGQDFHELSFFYRVELPGQGPNGTVPWLVRHDEGHDLQFYWVPLEGDALETINLLPGWLPEFLRHPPETLTHIAYNVRTV